jgi:GTPase Era involved in 16S rRNA processing
VTQLLRGVKGSVGFCSLAGKYRTGKSFLLNKLLGLEGSGVSWG